MSWQLDRLAPFSDVVVITPPIFRDDRGFFSETYNQEVLRKGGIDVAFVQDNQSLSVAVGVVRGLHFQLPPKAQDKLVRVVRGAIYDVVVDLREGSPTRGRHAGIELSAANWRQLFVPKGFAHGFCTLEPHTEVIYKVSEFYAPDHDRGVRWNDPALDIAWPVAADAAQLSAKDRALPLLADLPPAFPAT